MYINDEIKNHIDKYMGKTNSQNKKVILYYYGFIDGSWPDFREVGKKFTAQKNTKNTGSRPHQLITDFKKTLYPLSSLILCEQIISRYDFITISQLSKIFNDKKIIPNSGLPKANLRGILSLLNDIGRCKEYKIYTANLKEIQRKSFVNDQEVLLIKHSLINKLKSGRRKAYSLPGTLGLANFSYLKSQLGENYKYFYEVCEIIQSDPNNVIVKYENEVYYFTENKKNTFLQSMGKIFNGIANQVKTDELAKVLHNSFRRRGKIEEGKHPEIEVIKSFLENYKKTKTNGNFVIFTGEKQNLEKIDKAILRVLTKKPYLESTELIEKLLKLGFKKSYIEKNRYSPLVQAFIDDAGRYRFSVIGTPIRKAELNKIRAINYSISDLERDLRKNRETGKKGEKFIENYLKKLKAKNKIKDFYWTSKNKVNANHDFQVTENNGFTTYIEVKSTKNKFEDNIYISYGELKKAESEIKYKIYRVYELTKSSAKLRISENLNTFVTNFFEAYHLNEVLTKTIPSILLISPTILRFEKEIIIHKS